MEYWDSQLPGFGLRVSASGRKSWVAMYRVGTQLVRETIGSLAVIPNVADAREHARLSMQKAQGGTHPLIEKRMQIRTAEVRNETRPLTFRDASQRYVDRYAKKNTKPITWKELERQLAIDVNPKWGDRAITSIARLDVAELLDGIVDRGSPMQANRTLARLKTLFRWALDEEIVTADPTARVRKVVKEIARDRVLTDHEIRIFWLGCDKLGWPFGPMFKLLLLTAQRRDEVATVEWSEIDLTECRWTIPREKAKNDRAHEVHLSELAIEIIEHLPKIGEVPRFILTTNEKTSVSGFSKSKLRLDEHMVEILREELATMGADAGAVKIDDWVLHDLRRTATTGMAKLNIAPHVVDRILNHVSGTIRGVAAVYNRHAYLDERKAALDAWSRYVESLVRASTSNVVPMIAGR